MKGYVCTYVTSPEIDTHECNAISTVTVKAISRREAGRVALSLPLPDGADHLQVHVGDEDMQEEAGFELFDKEVTP